MRLLIDWFRVLVSGRPHFYIGGRDDPYMLRWYLIPRNRWLNLYLHKFMRDDDDRALHDHPWWFLSLMLWGYYIESRDVFRTGPAICYWRFDREKAVRISPSIVFRRATDRHRVTLAKNHDGTPVPCWTLVLTGPKVRTWGFWCPQGFVKWTDFVAQDDHGNIGRGCGET